jgi:high affinity sulfate transporter 1
MATDGSKAQANSRPRSVLSWLPGYRREWLRSDLSAGLASAAIVIPKAMACAVIAGLSVQSGLYTALAALLVYPLLGTSRLLSVSTTSTLAIMTAAAVAEVSKFEPGVAPGAVGMTVALLAGAAMLVAGAIRVGYLANFISTPVLTGFQAGAGAAIVVTQVGPVLGAAIHARSSLGVLSELPRAIGSAHLPTVLLSIAGIALLLLLERRAPRLPAALVFVVLSIAAAALFRIERFGVALVGQVPSGFPTPLLPDLSLAGRLWVPALGIALMSLTESVAAARSFARPEERRVDPDRELTAVGAANVACAALGGFPAGGGLSQTAVNDASGAKSQLAGAVTGLGVAITLLALSPVIGRLPKASLAALVIVVAASMIKPTRFRSILRVRSDEFVWALVAAFGVFFIGILEGVLIAVTISLLTLLYQANHPPVYEIAYCPDKGIFRKRGTGPGEVTIPGLLVLRTEGRLHFANAFRAGELARALAIEARPKVIVFEMSAVPDIEYTALMSLDERVREDIERGVEVWLAAINPDLQKVIARSPLGMRLGPKRIFPDLFDAVEAYRVRTG